MENTSKVNANVHIELFGNAGMLKNTFHVHNTMMASGLANCASRIASSSSTAPTYMDWGTGTTGFTGTNSMAVGTATIGTPSTIARKSATITRTSGTAVASYVATWGVTEPATEAIIREVGLYGSVTGVTLTSPMYAYVDLNATPITKSAGDTLTITWTITVA